MLLSSSFFIFIFIFYFFTFQVPRNRYWGLHPPPVLIEEVVDNGLMAIQRAMFLRKAGVDTGEDRVYLLDPPTRADLLESAIQSLIRFIDCCSI